MKPIMTNPNHICTESTCDWVAALCSRDEQECGGIARSSGASKFMEKGSKGLSHSKEVYHVCSHALEDEGDGTASAD